jgi:pimeloyl-ACP methyl ester carboxylesterase
MREVPSSNSVDLAHRLPNAELVLYDDAGHGGIFQYHEQFVTKALGRARSARKGAGVDSSRPCVA